MTAYVVLWIVGGIALFTGLAVDASVVAFLGVAIAAVGFGLFVLRGQRTSASDR